MTETVEDLEQRAADAAAAAQEARERAEHRRRVESAARLRAEIDHANARLDTGRDREVRAALDTAWTTLVDALVEGADPMTAWAAYNSTRGALLAELHDLATGASLAGRRDVASVPSRLIPGAPDGPTLRGALDEAALRVERAAFDRAHDETVERLDADRDAAIGAHLATVDLDGPVGSAPVVATFVDCTPPGSEAPWSTSPAYAPIGAGLPEELTAAGRVAKVHTARTATAIRALVTDPSRTAVAEVDEETAQRVEAFESDAGRVANLGEVLHLVFGHPLPDPEAPTARRRTRRRSAVIA